MIQSNYIVFIWIRIEWISDFYSKTFIPDILCSWWFITEHQNTWSSKWLGFVFCFLCMRKHSFWTSSSTYMYPKFFLKSNQTLTIIVNFKNKKYFQTSSIVKIHPSILLNLFYLCVFFFLIFWYFIHLEILDSSFRQKTRGSPWRCYVWFTMVWSWRYVNYLLQKFFWI